MKNNRRKFSSEFKARVALEAIKEPETLVQLSKKDYKSAIIPDIF
jgi:transposase-like protein